MVFENDPERKRRASVLRRRRSSLLRQNSVLHDNDMFLSLYSGYLGLKCGLQTQELAAIAVALMVRKAKDMERVE